METDVNEHCCQKVCKVLTLGAFKNWKTSRGIKREGKRVVEKRRFLSGGSASSKEERQLFMVQLKLEVIGANTVHSK